jgi:hypothetical protein
MITSWRIVKARYAGAAFDGEGARVVGGRWSSRGTPMIYTLGQMPRLGFHQGVLDKDAFQPFWVKVSNGCGSVQFVQVTASNKKPKHRGSTH